MKKIFFPILLLLYYFNLNGQTVSGKIIDGENNPIEFVSIGIIDEPIGTISDENGNFSLDTKGLIDSKIVRFSMIGFEEQIYNIRELLNHTPVIKLKEKPTEIEEIVIKPGNKTAKIGTTGFSWGKVCGWGGTQFGDGNEIGNKISLGDNYVKINSLHLRVSNQSFDSSLFRLHIRDIVDGFPKNELLNKNIYFTISRENGWVEIDLSKYSIIQKKEIVISIEWLKIFGIKKDKMKKINNSKNAIENVLFSVKKDGNMYVRWGSEAKWKIINNQSPSIYVTVVSVK